MKIVQCTKIVEDKILNIKLLSLKWYKLIYEIQTEIYYIFQTHKLLPKTLQLYNSYKTTNF